MEGALPPFLARLVVPGPRPWYTRDGIEHPDGWLVLKLLSYNVLEGAAPDRLGEVLRVIESANADVVAIQEARYWRRNRRAIFNLVRRRLGMRGILAPANSGFDLVLFSRHRILAYANLGRDTMLLHTALTADIETPSGATLSLFVAHLRPDMPGRVRETHLLLEWMAPYRDRYCALCGDLNSVAPGDSVAHNLIWPGSELGRVTDGVIASIRKDGWRDCMRLFNPRAAGFTLGVGRRVARVDYVFASRPLAERLTACRVHQHPSALAASDHSPVWAEFDL
jgi:endonuclease/exonuclease/phosphatase family metal-dependent hydrolase